jgi:uncharacterized protein YbcI
MNSINKNNYEAFFLDYHEGNLSPQQVADLLLFIAQHPELKEEFESFENVTLDDVSEIEYSNKADLKKEITIANRTDYFIASVENTLSAEEQKLVALFIQQHPKFLPEFQLFQKTKITVDDSIVFENKERLKKASVLLPKKEVTSFPSLGKVDELLIASLEGVLSEEEQLLLTQQLTVDAEMQHQLNLFKQTKLVAESAIVFENKERLKRKEIVLLSTEEVDNLLIASVEGILSSEEQAALSQQLAVDANMQQQLNSYQQTKLIADATIVYENKDELKREKKKVIPFFYYVAAAASVVLLFGLFSLFNGNKTNEQEGIAAQTEDAKKTPVENKIDSTDQLKNNAPLNTTTIVNKTETAAVVKNKKNPSNRVEKNNVVKQPVNTIELTNQPVVKIKEEERKQIAPIIEAPKEDVLVNNEQPKNTISTTAPTNDVIASIQEKTNSRRAGTEYLSLKELATEKIKEKTLDDNTIAAQKKTGKLNNFSGWDFAQIVTKGISKLTGRNVEVKPTYNDEGVVTAYALGGMQISRGK